MTGKPLAIDLCCGLGGWTSGLLAEGFDVIGFDIEQHVYGEHRYPAQLVIQDVLTLHGSQFKDVSLIVASPPCQFFSYTAMPWSRAKALAAKVRADPALLAKELALFNACFRLQREACDAAGRYIPLVVENVRGAIPWVGCSRWNFGSYYLWGDVPALMPPTIQGVKVPSFRFDGNGGSFQTASVRRTNPGNEINGLKRPGIKLSEIGFNVDNVHEFGSMVEGVKIKRSERDIRDHIGTKRKFASAMIAKIPEPLSRHIARTFLPEAHHAFHHTFSALNRHLEEPCSP